MLRTSFTKEIALAAAMHDLSPEIVEAVVRVESSGHAYAYRYEPAFFVKYMADRPEWKGANSERVSASYGLMQVMYAVAIENGFRYPDPEYLFVPSINLNVGCRVLARLLEWAGGDYMQALAAYNGGRGGNEKPPFRNQGYALRVFAARDDLLKGTNS